MFDQVALLDAATAGFPGPSSPDLVTPEPVEKSRASLNTSTELQTPPAPTEAQERKNRRQRRAAQAPEAKEAKQLNRWDQEFAALQQVVAAQGRLIADMKQKQKQANMREKAKAPDKKPDPREEQLKELQKKIQEQQAFIHNQQKKGSKQVSAAPSPRSTSADDASGAVPEPADGDSIVMPDGTKAHPVTAYKYPCTLVAT